MRELFSQMPAAQIQFYLFIYFRYKHDGFYEQLKDQFFFSVENEKHCDFVKLREMVLRVNMEDLREQTHARHYELYRRCKLEEMGFKDTGTDSQSFRWN